MRNYENPTYGGWGGRFEKTSEFDHVYKDAFDDGDKHKSLEIWIDDVNRDFQSRMDWCIAEKFEDANHKPEINILEDQDRTVNAGEKVTLVTEIKDPNGDEISVNWWQYKEAGSYKGLIELQNVKNVTLSFIAPQVSKQETIHIILEVTDNGNPSLSSYKRFVLSVSP